jgi:2-oxoglutarate dehydrogenase E1 component
MTLKAVIGKYKRIRQFIWVQEEPENMGAWVFVRPRLEKLTGKPLEYIGRNPAASPATGFPSLYRKEQAAVTEQALEMVVSGSKQH